MFVRIAVAAVCVLLFLVESTWLSWWNALLWDQDLYLASHWLLVFALYISLFWHRYLALAIGLVFGFLHDIVFYGSMIGLYTAAMGLSAYFAGWLFQRFSRTFFSVQATILFGLLLMDGFIYLAYRLFNLLDGSVQWAVFHYILPNVLLNMCFSIAVYVPARWLIDKAVNPHREEED